MSTAPVLALIGDRYHNPDFIRLNFNRLFAELGIAYDYTVNYEWFADEESTDAQLAGRSLLIVARDGYIFPDGYIGPEAYSHYVTRLMDGYPDGPSTTWVDENDGFGTAVRRFVEAGGSLFAWHNSVSVATFSPAYREVSGGVYDGHPSERPWKVGVIDHDHPVTRGVRDFMVTDEQHFPIHDRSDGELLLRGINVDELTFDSPSGAVQGGTVSAAAWAHEAGQGRVLMSALGHNLDALWKPDYWTFQKNAIQWLLHKT